MWHGYDRTKGVIRPALRWLTGAVLLLVLVAGLTLVAAWWYVSQDRAALRQAVEDALEVALDRDVAIRGEIDLRAALRPTVALGDITVANADWGAPRPMLSIGSLEVTFRLTPLLTRQSLVLRRIDTSDVEIWIENNARGDSNWSLGDDDDPAPLELREIEARDLRVIYYDWEQDVERGMEINRVSARPTGDDGLLINMDGRARDLPVTLDLSLEGRRNLLRGQGFPLAFEASVGETRLTGYGTLAELDFSDAAGTDLRINVAGDDLRNFQRFTDLDLPRTGPYELSMDLDSDAAILALDDIRGSLAMDVGDIGVHGTVGDLLNFSDLDLTVTADGGNLREALNIQHWLADTETFHIAGRMTGSWDTPELTDIEARLANEIREIDATGQIVDARRGLGIDLALVVLATHESSLLSDLLGTPQMPVDSARSALTISGDWPALAVNDIDILWVRGEERTTATGRVADLQTQSGVDLAIDTVWDDLRTLEPVTGLELYETDRVHLKGRITGDQGDILLEIDEVEAVHRSDRLQATGRISGIGRDAGRIRTDLQIVLEGDNIQGLGEDFDLDLPATRGYRVRGRLTGRGTDLDLRNARVSASREGLILEAEGDIRDFFGVPVLGLGFTLTGESVTDVGGIIGVELPESDAFRVRGRAAGPVDTFRLEGFEGSASRGSVQLSAQGDLTWADEEATFSATGRLAAATLAEIGEIFDLELSPIPEVSANFTIEGQPQAFRVRLDDLALDDSNTAGQFDLQIPETGPVQVRGGLDKGTLRLDTTDYMDDSPAASDPSGRLLPDLPIDGERFRNLDLEVSASGVGLLWKLGRFDFVDAKLVIRDRVLSLEPGQLEYAGGTLNTVFTVDARAVPPVSNLRAEARGMDFGQLLRELARANATGGTLSAELELEGRGGSLREQMAAANGRLGVLTEGGTVEAASLKLLATDLIFKSLPWSRKVDTIALNCTMHEWTLANGVATAGLLFVDGENLVISGSGQIDLSDEALDLHLQPRPKKGRVFAHRVDLDIKGTLGEPKIKTDASETMGKGILAVGKYVLLGPAGLLVPTSKLNEDYPQCASSLRALGKVDGEVRVQTESEPKKE